MFTRITVRNFRLFENLELTGLSRVNLIGGANNVGKTSLLEAIFLLLGATNPELTLRVNQLRGIHAIQADMRESWGWLFRVREFEKEILVAARSSDGMTHELQVASDPVATRVVGAAGESGLSLTKELGSAGTQADSFSLSLRYTGPNGQSLSSRVVRSWDGNIHMTPGGPALFPAVFLSTRSRPAKEDCDRFSYLQTAGREAEVIAAL